MTWGARHLTTCQGLLHDAIEVDIVLVAAPQVPVELGGRNPTQAMPVSGTLRCSERCDGMVSGGDRTRYTIRQSGKASSSVWIRIPSSSSSPPRDLGP